MRCVFSTWRGNNVTQIINTDFLFSFCFDSAVSFSVICSLKCGTRLRIKPIPQQQNCASWKCSVARHSRTSLATVAGEQKRSCQALAVSFWTVGEQQTVHEVHFCIKINSCPWWARSRPNWYLWEFMFFWYHRIDKPLTTSKPFWLSLISFPSCSFCLLFFVILWCVCGVGRGSGRQPCPSAPIHQAMGRVAHRGWRVTEKRQMFCRDSYVFTPTRDFIMGRTGKHVAV